MGPDLADHPTSAIFHPTLHPEISPHRWPLALRLAMEFAWSLGARQLPCRVHHTGPLALIEILGNPRTTVWVMRSRPGEPRFHWGDHHEEESDPSKVAAAFHADVYHKDATSPPS